MADEPSHPEEDSSHVVHLYRSVRLTRSALVADVGFAVCWLLVALGVPLAIGAITGAFPTTAGSGAAAASFALVAIFGGSVALLALGAAALLAWRGAVRALARDLPKSSPWVDEVLRPVRRSWWFAFAALLGTIAASVALLVTSAVLAMSPGESGSLSSSGWNVVLLTFVGVFVALPLVGHLVALRAVALPIGGSGVPEIDASLRRALRLTSSTLWLALVPVALFVVAVAFPGGPSTAYWPLGWSALVAPLGLLYALFELRRATGIWLRIAERLVGRTIF